MVRSTHDYAAAHVLRLKGLQYKDIARELQIPEAALQRYAHRHKWDEARQRASDKVSASVLADTMTFAECYVQKAAAYGDKALNNIISRGFDMSLNDLGKLATVAHQFDTLTRRALRIDAEALNHTPSLAVQVNVHSEQPSKACYVIDQDASDAQPVDSEPLA